ncbi:hypothetical protein Nepgr_021246 [Nepenthes gracilis]|uniref:Integrase catalytic domain-containing protein n=1 Tax=Nepenthes gracilis TaxID=150966 RepID=A0AAD3SYA8_NEPGR|nr:hypothetical protein Nepgr_021246 [Nepenthes gracilis]
MRETLNAPSIEKQEAMQISETENWMTPYLRYLADGSLPEDTEKAKQIKKTAGWYTGYYWPSMKKDALEFVKKCESCQLHGNLHHQPSADLKFLQAPWSFAQWGLDILGPCLIATGQRKFIIAGIDYFTKWVEAAPLAKITEHNALEFLRQSIVCRFGVPEVVVTDNGTQFSGKRFTKYCTSLGIKLVHTSVAYPQANGQVEVTNRTLLHGLKTKLEDAGGSWADELPSVLWSYRWSPSTHRPTPRRSGRIWTC